MPRKSPRARKKDATPPRVPGKGRPRATPGATTRGRLATKRREQEPRHALKGARTTAKTKGRPRAAKPALRSRAAKPEGRPGVAKPARRPRFTAPDPARIAAILGILERTYPEATTALDFETPLQLLIATILSAQCTDARVNIVTPVLFERWSDARALAQAPIPELEDVIRSTGFYRNKAKSIHSCTTDIVEKHGGEVPNTLEQLTALHGVGRKTANVVLGNAFGIPGVVVDTHVGRLSRRLGLTREMDPVKVEHALMELIPRDRWTIFSHWLILHGRRICVARRPRCSICPLAVHCPRIGVTNAQ
jgi:endonuclease-3